MSRQFGKWFLTCPVCGEEYVLTNWMRRTTAEWKDGRMAGWRSDDTHTLACERKLAALIDLEAENDG